MKQDEIVIQVLKNGKQLAVIDAHYIPDGATYRECYETATEFIICGQPREDDEGHNCDAMGCTTFNHVLHRVSKPNATAEARPIGRRLGPDVGTEESK